jgi:hypothetical protein
MARWLGVFLVTYFFTVGLVQAQTPTPTRKGEPGASPATGQQKEKGPEPITVDENEVNIIGWHGAGGSYFGGVRLTAKTNGGLKPSFLSSDLTREKDGMKVDRHNVTIDGEFQLSLGTPKNIKIKVTGIEEPGTYKGEIEFRPQGADSGKKLKLTVIAKATQPLTPLSGTDQIKLHLTSGIWSEFLPKAETIDSRELQFKNPFQLPVKLLKADFVLLGDQTGYQLIPPSVSVELKKNSKQGDPTGSQTTSTSVGVKKIDDQPHDPVIKLTLALNRDKIPPDKYTGSILLWFEGAKEALQLPVVEITMRHGPFRALFFLGIGIIIGLFLLYMKTEGLSLGKILRDIDDLRNQIRKIEIGDQDILETMLGDVELVVNQKKLENAKSELENIKIRLHLLYELEKIEKGLEKPIGNDVLELIRKIRVAVIQKKDAEARSSLDELKQRILTLRQAAVSNLIMTMQAYKMAMQAPKKAEPEPTGTPRPSSKGDQVKEFFQRINLVLLKWLGPPIHYLITSLILVVVGLVTLYLKNMTFGASPLVDYLGLILWGLGTDVASRNVANVLVAAKLTPK